MTLRIVRSIMRFIAAECESAERKPAHVWAVGLEHRLSIRTKTSGPARQTAHSC